MLRKFGTSWHRLAIAAAGLLLWASAHAGALPGNIPFKQATPEDDNLIYRAVAAFLFACAAAYGIAWLVKRYLPAGGTRKGSGQQLQRLEAMRLTQRSTLLRVRWGDEELLLGENEHCVSLLGRRPLADVTGTPGAQHSPAPSPAQGEVPHG